MGVKDYIKNYKKSFKYLSMDLTKDYTGVDVKDISENSRNIKNISKSVSGISVSSQIRSLEQAMKNNSIVSGIKGISNKLFSGIKNGSFYEEEKDDFGFGDFDSMFDDMDDLSLDGDDVSDEEMYAAIGNMEESKEVDYNNRIDVAKAQMKSMTEDVASQTGAFVDATKVSSDANVDSMNRVHQANTLNLFNFNSKILTSISSLDSKLDNINKFNEDIQKGYIEKSLKYYEDSLTILDEMKNISKASVIAEEERQEFTKANGYMDFLTTGDYKSALVGMTGKIKEEADSRFMGGMGSLLAPMIGQYAAQISQNPQTLLKDMAKGVGNKYLGLDKLRDGMGSIEDNVQGIVRKMSTSNNQVIGFLGDALRDKSRAGDYLTNDKYNKEKVYFDGVTRESIVEVIPTYLRKILASLTDEDESIYNYRDGKFRSLEDMKNTAKSNIPSLKYKGESFATTITRNLSDKHVSDVDESKVSEITNHMVKSLAQNNRAMSDILTMPYKKFLSVTGTKEEHLTKSDYNMIKSGVAKAMGGSREGAEEIKSIDWAMVKYNKDLKRYYDDLTSNARLTGNTAFLNNSTAFGKKGNKMAKPVSNSSMIVPSKESTNIDGVSKEYDPSSWYKDSEFHDKGGVKGAFKVNMSEGDEKYFNTRYDSLGMKDYMNLKKKSLVNSYIKNPDSKEKDSYSISNSLLGRDNSMILDADNSVDGTKDQNKAFKSFQIKAKLINATKSLTSQEKFDKIKELSEKNFKDNPLVQSSMDGLIDKYSSVIKTDKKGMTADDRGNIILKSLAGGAGAFVGLKFLKKHLPQAGILGMVGGGAGALAPIALASMAVGGTIYATKDIIKEKFFGVDKEVPLLQATKEWLFGNEDGKEGVISKKWNSFKTFFGDKKEKLGGWFNKTLKDPFMNAIGEPWKEATENFKGLFKGLTTKIGSSFKEGMFAPVYENLIIPIKDGFQKLLDPITNMFSGFSKWLGGAIGSGAKGLSNMFFSKEKKEEKNKIKEKRASGRSKYEGMSEEDKAIKKSIERKKKKKEKHGEFGKGYNIPISTSFGMGYYYSQNGKYGQMNIGGLSDSTSKVKLSGCSLMTAAMALSNLLNEEITPNELVEHARRYKFKDDGVSPGFFKDVAKSYSIASKFFYKNEISASGIDKSIKKGNQVIALIKHGRNLHYILLTGSKGNSFIYDDPAIKSGMKISKSTLHAKLVEAVVFFKLRTKNGKKDSSMLSSKIETSSNNSSHKEIFDSANSNSESSNISVSSPIAHSNASNSNQSAKYSSAEKGINGYDKIVAAIEENLVDVSWNIQTIRKAVVKKLGYKIEEEEELEGRGKIKGRTKFLNKFLKKFKLGKKGFKFSMSNPFSMASDLIGSVKNKTMDMITSVYDNTLGLAKEKVLKAKDGLLNAFKSLVGTEDEPGIARKSFRYIFGNNGEGGLLSKGYSYLFDGENGIFPKIGKGLYNGLIGSEEKPGAIRNISRGLFGYKDKPGFFQNMNSYLIGDSSNPGVLRQFGSYLMGTDEKPGVFKKMGNLLIGDDGILTGAWNSLIGTKDKPGLFRSLGVSMIDAGKGLFEMLGNISGVGTKGTKEIYIAGGQLDNVKSVGVIGSLGAVDADSYKELSTKIRVKSSPIMIDSPDKTSPVKSPNLLSDTKMIESSKGIRTKDKIQDIVDAKILRENKVAGTMKDKKEKKDNGSIMNKIMMDLAPVLGMFGLSTITGIGDDIIKNIYDKMGVDGELQLELSKGKITRTAISKGVKMAGSGAKKLSKGKDLLKKFSKKATKETGENIAEKMISKQSKGILGKVTGILSKTLSKIFGSKTIKSILGEGISNKILSGITKMSSKIGSSMTKGATKGGSKSLIRLSTLIPGIGQALDVGFIAWDLWRGMSEASGLFGVKQSDVTPSMKYTAGVVNALQGFVMGKLSFMGALAASMFPTEWLIDFIYGLFGDKDELEAKRQRAEAEYQEVNESFKMANEGEELDKDDYLNGKVDATGKKVTLWNKVVKDAKGLYEKGKDGLVEWYNTSSVMLYAETAVRFTWKQIKKGFNYLYGKPIEMLKDGAGKLWGSIKDKWEDLDIKERINNAKDYVIGAWDKTVDRGKDMIMGIIDDAKDYVMDSPVAKTIEGALGRFRGLMDMLKDLLKKPAELINNTINKVKNAPPVKYLSSKYNAVKDWWNDDSESALKKEWNDAKSKTKDDREARLDSLYNRQNGITEEVKMDNGQLFNNVVDDLKRHEGFSSKAYKDTEGIWTIGYGLNLNTVSKKDRERYSRYGISEEEASNLLRKRVSLAWKQTSQGVEGFENLDPERKGVLINMAYNMGIGSRKNKSGLLGFSSTLNYIKNGEFDKAADQMEKSLWYKQTKGRAKELVSTMRTGKSPKRSPIKYDGDKRMVSDNFNKLKDPENKRVGINSSDNTPANTSGVNLSELKTKKIKDPDLEIENSLNDPKLAKARKEEFLKRCEWANSNIRSIDKFDNPNSWYEAWDRVFKNAPIPKDDYKRLMSTKKDELNEELIKRGDIKKKKYWDNEEKEEKKLVENWKKEQEKNKKKSSLVSNVTKSIPTGLIKSSSNDSNSLLNSGLEIFGGKKLSMDDISKDIFNKSGIGDITDALDVDKQLGKIKNNSISNNLKNITDFSLEDNSIVDELVKKDKLITDTLGFDVKTAISDRMKTRRMEASYNKDPKPNRETEERKLKVDIDSGDIEKRIAEQNEISKSTLNVLKDVKSLLMSINSKGSVGSKEIVNNTENKSGIIKDSQGSNKESFIKDVYKMTDIT